MAAHSTILAWKNPWTEPGGLQSKGSHKSRTQLKQLSMYMYVYMCVYAYICILYIYISPGEGNSYPLQYSGLENSMDCIVHGVTKSQT